MTIETDSVHPLRPLGPRLTAIVREARNEIVLVCDTCEFTHTIDLREAMQTALRERAAQHAEAHP